MWKVKLKKVLEIRYKMAGSHICNIWCHIYSHILLYMHFNVTEISPDWMVEINGYNKEYV